MIKVFHWNIFHISPLQRFRCEGLTSSGSMSLNSMPRPVQVMAAQLLGSSSSAIRNCHSCSEPRLSSRSKYVTLHENNNWWFILSVSISGKVLRILTSLQWRGDEEASSDHSDLQASQTTETLRETRVNIHLLYSCRPNVPRSHSYLIAPFKHG